MAASDIREKIPHTSAFDSTFGLLRDGYRFIEKRRHKLGGDRFATRLLLRKVTCISGEEAAELFYGDDRFTRRQAMPPTTLRLLQDKGSVQMLDGEAHRHRKQMFMSLLDEPGMNRLGAMMESCWQERIAQWARADRVVLLDATREVLCQAVCAWAGIPQAGEDLARRTREFGAMIDGAGGIGPRTWWALLLRQRSERWAREVIGNIRTGRLDVPAGSAARVIANHRDAEGRLLPVTSAAVELINVLRPTVAVARFIVFAALALHEHPEMRDRLRYGGDAEREGFVQEVRRYYPYFPMIGGRARYEFTWRHRQFPAGSWVLLDLYGTDHDPAIWGDPEVFRPDRFRQWNGSAYNFIPQGAGDFYRNHRCPGEWATIDLMKRAVRLLTTAMTYEVPPQATAINLRHMPAIPKSRFVIANVQPTARE